MMSGLINFASPWLLAGLLALPLIWWLLRLMPPAPARVVFPPARLLAELVPSERTPAHSPWWLTLIRMLAAAILILALAGPFYTTTPGASVDGRPVLLIVDNGWAAASRWKARQHYISAVIRRAEHDNQPVYLAPSAGLPAGWRPQPLTPEEARNAAAALQPLPVPPSRIQLAQALQNGLDATGMTVIWLGDGVNDPGAAVLLEAAKHAASGGGSFTLASDEPQSGALGLSGHLTPSRQLSARILGTGEPRAGVVNALSARGEHLGSATFTTAPGSRRTDIALDLPVALQNQVTELEISGETSAGAVFLLDSRSYRHRAGVISGDRDSAQPLLSPVHYIEKALSPFAEVLQVPSGSADEGVSALLAQKPSVMLLADVGRLVPPVEARLKQWVEKGGLLIRFAGVRMEQGSGELSPARLRRGERTLGGALSWSTPQELAAFEKSSPFFGLSIPPEVNVTRQILADPSSIDKSSEVWARLRDGTPMVTAEKTGAGRIVLFHVTGNPDWSNLPISGLFVDMFRRILEQAATAMNVEEAAPAADTKTADAIHAGGEGFLVPWRTLDGYGRLGAPAPKTKAIAAAAFARQVPAPDTPPGFYGPPGNARALNLITEKSNLEPLAAGENLTRITYGKEITVFFTPWLWLAALALFMADALATLVLMSPVQLAGALRARTLMFAGIAIAGVCLMPSPAGAGAAKRLPGDSDVSTATIDAALQTRLAYVLTGDAAVDEISRAGLAGLTKVLAARTAIEPAEAMGVNAATDELSVFPLLYWPVLASPAPLSDAVLTKVDAYMKNGGMILFDTRDSHLPLSGMRGGGMTPLAALLSKLDIPRLEPVSDEHVVTKSFYLLRSFPGRWDGGELWVEAQTNVSDMQTRRALKSDGVSAIMVTSNDFAAAWALDGNNRPQFPAVPGGEEQREMAYRVGVNIVMYALTGNYKADQVHVPALLERLGH
jgi:hypothetical protein